MVRTGPEPFTLVVSVTLDQRGILTDQHAGQVVRLEFVPQIAQRLERHAKRRLGVDLGFGVEAVVAAAAVLLGIFLPEIVQQRLATAHRTFGVRHGFEQQQLADLLLGHRLSLHELLQLLNILITIKGKAVSVAAVASRTPRLLIISLQRLGNIVMDHIAHVGFVDTHAESDRGHDHIGPLHQEVVLIGRTCLGVHTGVIGQSPDAVGYEQLRKLLDLLAAQAVDDAALALVLLDVTDNLPVHIVLGPDFVIQVGAVERRLEYRSVAHTQVFLDVHLHLGRSRRRQGDQGRRADFVDDRTDAAVLRTEIVPPLRNTVRLVDGVERNLDLAQKRHVVLFGERLRSEVEQLGPPLQHIVAHLRDSALVQGRVQEVSDSRIVRIGAHGIHLVFHQGDQRRYDDRHAVHQQGGQLVTQGLAAAGRHQHERIFSTQHIANHGFLIPLE